MSASIDHKHDPAPESSAEAVCRQSRELRAKADALLIHLKATILQAQALYESAAALIKASAPLRTLPPSLSSREEGQAHHSAGQKPSTASVPSSASVEQQDTNGNSA